MKTTKLLAIAFVVFGMQACTSGDHSVKANDTAATMSASDMSNKDTSTTTTYTGGATTLDNTGSGGTKVEKAGFSTADGARLSSGAAPAAKTDTAKKDTAKAKAK